MISKLNGMVIPPKEFLTVRKDLKRWAIFHRFVEILAISGCFVAICLIVGIVLYY
jgi:hypothetical protein